MACAVATPAPEPSGDFPAWLEAQGVNEEVARAMDSELGIRDYGVLRACVGDGLVRAELLAAARDRLPFGFYAVLRQVVKALRGAEPHDAGTSPWNATASSPGDVTLGGLVDVLLALFSGLSRELLLSVQRLGGGGGGNDDGDGGDGDDGSDSGGWDGEDCGDGQAEEDLVEAWDEIKTEHKNSDEGVTQVSEQHGARPGFSGAQLKGVVMTTTTMMDVPDDEQLTSENAEGEGGSGGDDLELSVNDRENLNLPDDHYNNDDDNNYNNDAYNNDETYINDNTYNNENFNNEDNYIDKNTATAETSNSQPALCSGGRDGDGSSDSPSQSQAPEKSTTIAPASAEKARPHQCLHCDSRFFKTDDLKRHMRTHTGERPYCCEVCGRAFSQLCNLKKHWITHTGERQYRCALCGRAFKHFSGLRLHERTHTGERPYGCDVCGRAFAHYSNMKAHRRTHTGEKPYTCDVCGRAFSQVGNMKMHLRMHHGGQV
ncbi:zinc finger protein 37-like [Lethenteron reissneri]|uniref:zinc finger protein 37-like n=1 Tax=Lethenteron reissneri TaxID=7753 RepID=UPI002AB642C1|nr:zinc finger protein 37-like [Lethenteron reissneri]